MAKIKTYELNLKGFSKTYIDINVSASGDFYCIFPEDLMEYLHSVGVATDIHKIYERRRSIYKYSAKTLEALEHTLYIIQQKFNKAECIEEKIILKYSIETACFYSKDKGGDFIPYRKYDSQDTQGSGTKLIYATKPSPFGLQVYVKPFKIKKMRYLNGDEKEIEEWLSDREVSDEQKNLKFLAGVCCISTTSEESRVIDYNEEIAGFFVDLLKAIFILNEKIKPFISEDAIKKLVENNQKLLG